MTCDMGPRKDGCGLMKQTLRPNYLTDWLISLDTIYRIRRYQTNLIDGAISLIAQ